MKIFNGKGEEIDLNKSDSVIRKQICDSMFGSGVWLKTKDGLVVMSYDSYLITVEDKEDGEKWDFTNEDEAYIKFRILVGAIHGTYLPHL